MSAAQTDATTPMCPRCRSTTSGVLTSSPVPGVWTLYQCTTCLYVWRSTEPEENTNPDKYPPAFRLDPQALPTLPVMPGIPPLRKPPRS